MKKILLTGGTGFIGSFLGYKLLKKGYQVIFHARSRKNRSAQERIEDALKFVGPIDQYRDSFLVVEGDLSTGSDLGLPKEHIEVTKDVDEVFHCAASIKFRRVEAKTTYDINVIGTKNVLDFMKQNNILRLHHLSTAYVCGDKRGIAYEDELEKGQCFRNPYESTKYKAEIMVRESGMKVSIYRLGIVVGDSETGKTIGFTGYYGYFIPFWFLKGQILGRYLNHETITSYREAGIILNNQGVLNLPIVVKHSSVSDLNLVPIDWAVNMMLRLSEKSKSIGKAFHLTHPNPPQVEWIIKMSLKILEIKNYMMCNEGQVIQTNPILRKIQTKIDEVLDLYAPYTTYEPQFDNSNVRKVLGNDYTPPAKIDEKFLEILLDYAVKRGFGRKAMAKTKIRRKGTFKKQSNPTSMLAAA